MVADRPLPFIGKDGTRQALSTRPRKIWYETPKDLVSTWDRWGLDPEEFRIIPGMRGR